MLGLATILGIFNWCLVFIAIFIYALIFYLMSRCSREARDISLLLTFNTCAAALLTCLTVSVMISSNLFRPFLVENMSFCLLWGLLYDVFQCSIYHSYCLQAFYRLCRVVFYKQKSLVSWSIYLILIVCQWSWILALLIPPVFINWYTRLPTENK
jgi:cbb3-type cytochrome oxidase subunit 3